MSDPTSSNTMEEKRPVADQVLMAVFWMLGNHIGAVLIAVFSGVFLFGVGIDPVAKAQIGMLAALSFSAILLQYASSEDGKGFWAMPAHPIANRRLLWFLAASWPFIILVQAMCAGYFLTGSFQARFSPIPPPTSQTLNWTIVLAIIVIVPIAEERFFRQRLWHQIECAGGPAKAFVWSASLFWLMHLPNAFFGGVSKITVANFLSLLPLTIALSWLRLKCGSARASLALHMLHNFVSIAPAQILRLLS